MNLPKIPSFEERSNAIRIAINNNFKTDWKNHGEETDKVSNYLLSYNYHFGLKLKDSGDSFQLILHIECPPVTKIVAALENKQMPPTPALYLFPFTPENPTEEQQELLDKIQNIFIEIDKNRDPEYNSWFFRNKDLQKLNRVNYKYYITLGLPSSSNLSEVPDYTQYIKEQLLPLCKALSDNFSFPSEKCYNSIINESSSYPSDEQYYSAENSSTQEPCIPKTEELSDAASKALQSILNDGVRQIIFTGAPGTGKTSEAIKIAQILTNGSSDKKRIKKVQFHPSYDYTDFVEGLRPVKTENGIEFVKIDGVFKEFCRYAISKKSSEQYFVFIIDEINRADLSKVFGELMYCLEMHKTKSNSNSDKYIDDSDKYIDTQYYRLPTYKPSGNENNEWIADTEENEFEKGFYIPENVIIIGTMNDIDRSVESMDFALRRRFEWKEFAVNNDTLKEAFEKIFKDNTLAENLSERVDSLNNYIQTEGERFDLNEHYSISQGYFANIPDKYINSLDSILLYVWTHHLESLLKEYLRGEKPSEIDAFIKACAKKLCIKRNTDDTEWINDLRKDQEG